VDTRQRCGAHRGHHYAAGVRQPRGDARCHPVHRRQAVTYLRARTRLRDDAGATGLADQLGWLPLALAQAGAIIGVGRRYPTYEHYLDRFDSLAIDQLLPPTSDDPYPHSAAKAILLALDDLTHADPSGHARRLLEHLAVLSPTGANQRLLPHLLSDAPPHRPRWWRRRRPPHGSVADLDAVVSTLAQRSLVTVSDLPAAA
jgi:hypothetical protein